MCVAWQVWYHVFVSQLQQTCSQACSLVARFMPLKRSVAGLQAGGYKISALAIENVLAAHPAVREVAVVGLPHPTLGDEITAVLACNPSQQVPHCCGAEEKHCFVLWQMLWLPQCRGPAGRHMQRRRLCSLQEQAPAALLCSRCR